MKSKLWESLGYMKILVESETHGEGGMRTARKAEILEGCNHPMLKQFTVGSLVVVKQYVKNVEKAAEEAERTIMSIAKRVKLTKLVH